MDPLFIEPAACASAGLSPSKSTLHIKSRGEYGKIVEMDSNALQIGVLAACTLQQGLGKLKDTIVEGSDPAIATSILSEVF